jgi:DNA-binding NarL/FixJ family response regulator
MFLCGRCGRLCGSNNERAVAHDLAMATAPRRYLTRRRILIIDDHALVRRGVSVLIDNERDLIVCAAAATLQEGLAAIATARPDLVIVDLSLGDDDGLVLVKDIRSGHAALPILVLSIHDAVSCAEQAFRAGANGYVTKQEMSDALLVAIRRVLGGESYASPKIRAALDAT